MRFIYKGCAEGVNLLMLRKGFPLLLAHLRHLMTGHVATPVTSVKNQSGPLEPSNAQDEQQRVRDKQDQHQSNPEDLWINHH